MKKLTATLIAITTIIVVLAAAATIYLPQTTSYTAQLPKEDPAQWQIKVTGDVTQEKTWTLKELTQMPLTDVTVKNQNATYCGVALSDFCSQTGILWDAGPLNIISATGQLAELNVFQAWNSTNYPINQDYNAIVLAFIKDGEWINDTSGGPVKLIAPSFASNYQVEQVAEIQSAPWTISIIGNVANPLEITGENLTTLQSQTLRGEFRPGGDPNRTSDWTGLPILTVLDTAKVSSQARQISVIGIDGYTKNFTLDQVREGQMMIGYQENGQSLPTSQGGPFRLFAPTDQYKWGQYWVKYIQEIKIS
jgi:DMSO/TMAO reductase YedYZ molybdopterin-dependent catalytic subunit